MLDSIPSNPAPQGDTILKDKERLNEQMNVVHPRKLRAWPLKARADAGWTSGSEGSVSGTSGWYLVHVNSLLLGY